MRKIILTIRCVTVVALTAMFAFKSLPQARAADINLPVNSQNQVVAYYFHGDFRCSNCVKIEQYSKEAIEKYFSDELNSGKLVFRVINVDVEGNEHYMKDYRLYTKSLVLSLVKNGKEIKYENLQGVWKYLGDKDGFYGYVKSSVETYLKEL